MERLIESTALFLAGYIPSWKGIFVGAPIGLAWFYACLSLAGHLKLRRGFKTGYSRKVFHFLVFTSVALIHWIWDVRIVCVFGASCTVVIFYAVFRGAGHPLYEALAREKDAPHRTHYIITPYFATLIGGLASNMLFGPMAIVGYLVTGFGDAVGEPIGTRFGRHTYRVPARAGVPAVRSWEGSSAVFVASLVAILAAVGLLPELSFGWPSMFVISVLGLACAVVEAVSPHGWDNATMQIVPSMLATLLL